jgi:putative transposase
MNTGASSNFNPEDFSFLTLSTYRKRNVFINEQVNEIICEALSFHINNGHVDIAGFVLMPDHIHFLIRPGDWSTSDFVNNFKTYTGIKTKDIGKLSRKVWRRRFYNDPVSDIADFRKKLDNIHANPVNKKMVVRPEDYVWSSAANYRGWPGIVRITVAPGFKK